MRQPIRSSAAVLAIPPPRPERAAVSLLNDDAARLAQKFALTLDVIASAWTTWREERTSMRLAARREEILEQQRGLGLGDPAVNFGLVMTRWR